MRRTLLLSLVVAVLATSVRADDQRGGRDRGRGRDGAELDVWVPIDPYEHERVWFMNRSDRTLVPPAVSIDVDPYICDLDERRFPDREHFVAHLRGDHGIPRSDIRRGTYQVDGRVHFAPE